MRIRRKEIEKATDTIYKSLSIVARRSVPIAPDQHLRRDLGIDSIGIVNLVVLLEQQLGLNATHLAERLGQAHLVADVLGIVHEVQTS